MVLKIRTALFPLYITSKILCIGPFSLERLQPSKFGTIITICQAVAYSIFHLWMSNRDMSGDSKNVVRQLIDSYNRFSGFCAFCFVVAASIFIQQNIVRVIQNIEDVDDVFQKKLNIEVDNQKWRRNISLQICLCISAISLFEWRNCLMYIQDSVPFSEYCLIMCLVPMYVVGITQIQFFAYLQLIRNRLYLLNKLLIGFSKVKSCNKKGFHFNGNSNAQENFRHSDIKSIWMSINELKPMQLEYFNNQIIQIQCIYSKLERSVIILKSAYSPHLVVILVMKFTTLTSLLYFCCMVIIKIISGISLNSENVDQLFSSVAWICAFIIEIFLLCYSCSITVNEAKRIGFNLHNFSLRMENVECKKKIKTFSVQLLFHRIGVNPFGLFILDLSFMYGLVGAVCTYLIILIQFDLAQKAQQQNGYNSTASSP